MIVRGVAEMRSERRAFIRINDASAPKGAFGYVKSGGKMALIMVIGVRWMGSMFISVYSWVKISLQCSRRNFFPQSRPFYRTFPALFPYFLRMIRKYSLSL